MSKTFILGAGGFAREVALILADRTHDIEQFKYLSDDSTQANNWYERIECAGSIDYQSHGSHRFVPGVGSPELRKELVERALNKGWMPSSAVSLSAYTKHIAMGLGVVICGGVQATVNVTLGNFVNVNLNCTLGHDCVIENYVNLSPAVNVSGYVHIEEGADIGTGAVLLPGVRIGKGAIIGAGAVVNKHVPAGETWVGVPAKCLRLKS
jgi:sugar O-acyltransferase (sialic acid O-acetyltransferase NeuD family)